MPPADPEPRERFLALRRRHAHLLKKDPAYAERYRGYDRDWKRDRYQNNPEYREKRKAASRAYQAHRRATDPEWYERQKERNRVNRALARAAAKEAKCTQSRSK